MQEGMSVDVRCSWHACHYYIVDPPEESSYNDQTGGITFQLYEKAEQVDDDKEERWVMLSMY
jgi:hypothetical protein